jgi:hypothetical protein
MVLEMPASYPSVKLFWIDCDQVADLVDQFEVDQIPALVLVHPHKTKYEIIQDLTPESLSAAISK